MREEVAESEKRKANFLEGYKALCNALGLVITTVQDESGQFCSLALGEGVSSDNFERLLEEIRQNDLYDLSDP